MAYLVAKHGFLTAVENTSRIRRSLSHGEIEDQMRSIAFKTQGSSESDEESHCSHWNDSLFNEAVDWSWLQSGPSHTSGEIEISTFPQPPVHDPQIDAHDPQTDADYSQIDSHDSRLDPFFLNYSEPFFLNYSAEVIEETRTTVIVRNIPQEYSQRMFYNEICKGGFRGCVDYFFIPMHHKDHFNFGYGFINFVIPELAQEFMMLFSNSMMRKSKYPLTCEWSINQGFLENLRKQRNTAICSDYMAPEFQPMLFDRWTGLPISYSSKANDQANKAICRRDAYEDKIQEICNRDAHGGYEMMIESVNLLRNIYQERIISSIK